MRMVKSLLLGTAAGFVALAGAQAADLPVKAKPVQYVKICDLYGAGYFYVPGTETCIKLGGYVRFNTYYNNTSGTVYTNGGFGRFNNAETKDVTTRARVYLTGDVRSQTSFGTLRSYYAVQIQNPTGNANGVGTGSAATVNIIRGFIQFAGFTIGRSTSLTDTPDAFSSLTSGGWTAVGGTTGPTGINVIQYTAQFGNGFSASVGLEDSDQRDRAVYNMSNLAFPGTDASSSGASIGSTVPEITANLDVTQAWGSARIVGAVHNVRAAYYSGPAGAAFGNCAGLAAAYPGNEACGRPSDKWGYFVGAGFTITAIPGMPGDLFGVSGGYADGASAYGVGFGGISIFKDGKATIGMAPDGVYVNGGGIQTTKSWWVSAAYQHAWTPNLKTSVYGAYTGVDFNSRAQSAIAPVVCGGGVAVGNCNPDYSYWLVGSRIFNWTPVQNLDIGLDIVYWKFNSAFKGPGNTTVPGGPYLTAKRIGDNDVWYANLQITRSFWP